MMAGRGRGLSDARSPPARRARWASPRSVTSSRFIPRSRCQMLVNDRLRRGRRRAVHRAVDALGRAARRARPGCCAPRAYPLRLHRRRRGAGAGGRRGRARVRPRLDGLRATGLVGAARLRHCGRAAGRVRARARGRRSDGRLQHANGRVESARYLGYTLGPLLGGRNFAAGGTRVALLVDAASFLAVAVAARRCAPGAGRAARPDRGAGARRLRVPRGRRDLAPV